MEKLIRGIGGRIRVLEGTKYGIPVENICVHVFRLQRLYSAPEIVPIQSSGEGDDEPLLDHRPQWGWKGV